MSKPTIESVIEEKPVKHRIAEYVEKKDIYGLAEYFRAYIEDEITESEERKLCNSGRRMYQQGIIDERTRCVEIVEKAQEKMIRKARITDYADVTEYDECANIIDKALKVINTNK